MIEIPLYAWPGQGFTKSERNLRLGWWSHFGNFSHTLSTFRIFLRNLRRWRTLSTFRILSKSQGGGRHRVDPDGGFRVEG